MLIGIVSINALDKTEVELREQLYREYSEASGIEWYIIAAVDQYERNICAYKNDCEKDLVSICIPERTWSGENNPVSNDSNPLTIYLFSGMGLDGNGDGLVERTNNDDKMHSMIQYLLDYGQSDKNVFLGINEYYKNEKAVSIIYEISEIFKKYDTIDLEERVYPIPKGYIEDYSNNYGTGRSYGGARMHEGIDIFANYWTPIVSTAYGYVEIMGWNEYGGYRIGIRDVYNTYEYYAHLSGYKKGLEEGMIVAPGDVIGYVGATGYGPVGTTGKFPPHLHFGFYKYDGEKEWSFNPYNYLNNWGKIKLQ